MELVYLWIEDYKNIKRQGFTFSPKFDCKYDPETNTLEIKEKKDYVNIFPDNINVTAIVGKNGAGKSSVLEVFYGYLYAKENRDNLNKCFIVCKDKNNKLFHITKKNIKSDYQYIEKEKFLNLSYSIFFDFTIFHTINNEGGEVYKKFYSIEPSRTFQTGNQISKVEPVSIHANLKMKSLYFYFLANENKNLLNKLNLPAIKKVKINNKKLLRDVKKIISIIETGLKNENLKGDNYQNFLKEILDKLNIILKKDKKENHENEITKIKNSIKNFFKLSQNDEQYILDTDFSFFKNKEDLIILEILNNIFPVELEFEYQEEYFTYSKLSTGQKIILSYIGIIANNILLYCDGRKIKNIFIFLDEVETGFHPAFQKNLLFIFENVLNIIFKEYNFSLFFLTHSPFILSDLPKENIIFMKDGKNVSNEINIETFGANIHTLLTHGFFMEDGLMGGYAKSKIDEVIKYLNNEESKIASDEEAQKIINIIGEPIIKKELQRKLDSKKLNKINEIEEKITILKERLEILRKNS
ncbi:AAA family ATPase [Caminibacter pacificus]